MKHNRDGKGIVSCFMTAATSLRRILVVSESCGVAGVWWTWFWTFVVALGGGGA